MNSILILSFAITQTMTCFSDKSTNQITAPLAKPGFSGTEWNTNSAVVEGTLNIETDSGTLQLPIKAEFEIESKDGNLNQKMKMTLVNPYLNQPEVLVQEGSSYNEASILKNRIHTEKDQPGLVTKDDIYAFGIMCSHHP